MINRLLPAIGLIAIGLVIILAFRVPRVPVPNPDPNHTHADFLVVLDGEPVDFSGDEFMTGASTEDHTRDPNLSPLRQFLHLHDGIGHVVHRHKPGLTLGDFFESIHVGFTANCIVYTAPLERDPGCSDNPWRMIVNGQERPFSLNYDFADGDKILLTTATDDAALAAEWKDMTDDACRYSKTCPWRGAPPAENCVADPTVPCIAPLQ
jgi:hypothetical protein